MRLMWLITWSIVCLSSLASAQKYPYLNYSFQFHKDGINLENFLPKDRLTFEELTQRADELQTYEALLAYLEERRPHFYENFVLLHSSGSLQPASFARPRVLSFGDGLVLAFSEPADSDDRRVEVLEFDGQEFHAREIRYTPSGVEFDPAPATCEACHGQPLRPIWNPYDFWPKAYGSEVARFHSAQEKKHYEKLKSTSSGQIYRRLRYIEEDYLSSNETFTQYLNQMNYISIAKTLQAHKRQLQPFLPALLAGLNRCLPPLTSTFSDINTYIPQDIVEHAAFSWRELFDETRTRRHRLNAYLLREYNRIFPNHQPLFDFGRDRLQEQDYGLSYLRFILENLGINWSAFMMSQGENRYSTSVPSNFAADLMTALYFFDPIDFRSLNPRATDHGGIGWYMFDCKALKKESMARLQEVSSDALHHRPVRQRARSIIGQCFECHSMDPHPDIPAIPFHDHDQLKQWLREGGMAQVEDRLSRPLGQGEMPPGGGLNQRERGLVLQIFRHLENSTRR